MSPGAIIGVLALVPAMFGPLDAQASQLTLALCEGGMQTIELPGQTAPLPGSGPCCAKGCRAGGPRRGTNRRRIDRAQ